MNSFLCVCVHLFFDDDYDYDHDDDDADDDDHHHGMSGCLTVVQRQDREKLFGKLPFARQFGNLKRFDDWDV